MEKIKNFLRSIDFVIVFMMAIVVRICVDGAGIGEALALGTLCTIKCTELTLKAFAQWLDTKKVEPLNETVAKELELIKASMGGLMMKNAVRPPSQDTQAGVPRKFF